MIVRPSLFDDIKQKYFRQAVSFDKPDGGMSVWATFHGTDLDAVEENSRVRGLRINNSRMYNRGPVYNTVRLGFASLNVKEQERAVEVLSQSLN